MRSDSWFARTLASLALCGVAAAGTPAVRVDQAWIRWLPAGVPSGGYATLTNIGEKPIVLVAATSPYFREISIHRSINRRGIISMEAVQEIILNPHSSIEFASTGYHLMLMQPTGSLESQRQVPVTLRFADGSSLTVSFDVRQASPGAASLP
jgi:periplasmic copper chaperone A